MKNVRLPGTSAWLCHCSELCLNSCSDDARLPGMSGCPAARKYARLPGNMPGCPAARYARLPGMPGCPELCPAVRKYARLSGCPVCPAVRYARLSGTMPGCPAVRNYVRLPGTMPGTMPGCPALAPRLPRLDAQRLLSAAPLATSTDRDERCGATTPQNRAQFRGRASGVRCKAMLGGHANDL